MNGATSELDQPSLTPLSVASCGLLQLRVPHWATSVDYCKQLTIDPTGRPLAIEDHVVRDSGDPYSEPLIG